MIISLKRIALPGNKEYQELTSMGNLPPHKSLLQHKAANKLLKWLDFMNNKYNLHPLFNDCFRSPQEQIKLKREKGNLAAYPGDSGHNWGISIDISTEKLWEEAKQKGIQYGLWNLVEDLKLFGWTPMKGEDWHFNFLENSLNVSDWVHRNYGDSWDESFDISTKELQIKLKRLGYYMDKVDGQFGPKTLAGVTSFQIDYFLTADGYVGPKTRRILQIATADFLISGLGSKVV